MNQRNRLLELLVERSLTLGEFTLASGAASSYYIDARLTTMSAEGQSLVGSVALAAIEAEGLAPDWVGGLTMGADPIAYAIAHRSWIEGRPINAFSVRKEVKQYGTGRQIEGGLTPGASALVVEDAMTSGASSLRAVDAVRMMGATVLGVLTLIDREEGGGERMREADVPVIRIFTASELLASAKPGPD